MSQGKGRGKVILLGEHAVVYGHPALAAALDLGVTATAAPAGDDAIDVPAWGVGAELLPAVRAIKAALGVAAPFALAVDAAVPPRAGLGSSAALAVAVTRALADRELTLDEVERVAGQAERVFHENPSGVDVALAARGGVGLFRRATGLEPIAAPPVRLAIGLSGEPRSTAARVADVAALRAARPGPIDAVLARLGELALAGRAALADPPTLGAFFDEAQSQLRVLGLSTPRLDELCARARDAGALGAKLTGAGGGGAVIAVGSEDDVVAAWRAHGFTAMTVEVGA